MNFLKQAINTAGSIPGVKQALQVSKSDRASSLGVAGDKLMEAIPGFIETPSEKVIANQNGASIVLGRDRPASRLSGYGGKGDTQCASIDIVTGRLGADTIAVNKNNESIYVDPHFQKDAARIYISQKTDIDTNFGLTPGKVGHSKAKSGIAIKADGLRLIAREGIKLITRSDIKNSQGGDVSSVLGIDLIAGNNDKDLQPMVKGENLNKALNKMVEHVDALSGIVDAFLTYQTSFNTAVMNHTHVVTGAGAGVLALPIPLPVVTAVIAVANPSIAACTSGAANIPALLTQVKSSIASFKSNLVMYKKNFYMVAGSEYINSRFNNTN
tara:strand:+ start:126 stop:1106 length:981 start_codon:yes stop_codon:yes gene_type:complete